MPRDAETSVRFSFCCVALRRVLELLVLRIRSSDFTELEILEIHCRGSDASV
jgi:hypothetical protein